MSQKLANISKGGAINWLIYLREEPKSAGVIHASAVRELHYLET
jgi:hypothetical protein